MLSDLYTQPPESKNGFKFEHILLSVTVAHNREIGQFDDSASYQVRKALLDYQGVQMVNCEAQYKHCSYDQHTEGCECGLCQQVRSAIKEGHNTHVPDPSIEQEISTAKLQEFFA